MTSDSKFKDLAARAAELGFKTTEDDYRAIENRIVALEKNLTTVRSIDVDESEPASTFAPRAREAR